MLACGQLPVEHPEREPGLWGCRVWPPRTLRGCARVRIGDRRRYPGDAAGGRSAAEKALSRRGGEGQGRQVGLSLRHGLPEGGGKRGDQREKGFGVNIHPSARPMFGREDADTQGGFADGGKPVHRS
jgi:hypothetical protein